jgi:uncharacterized membrane-anchored protein
MSRARLAGAFVVLLVCGRHAWAAPEAEPAATDQPPASADQPRPVLGPQKIDLGDDLVLDLPDGMGYFDAADGKKLMEKMGNRVGDAFRGLVFKREGTWAMEVEYVGDGYVKDDDAANLKPDEILKSLKEGTEEANAYRKQRGFAAVHVDDWTEPPHYERAQHHLIWGIKGEHDDGSPASVNFYTRVLGRHGFVALNLMDDPSTIEASKVEALAVLRATTFKPGARYEDFNKKNDKVAEYGLGALVLGGAGVAALKLAKVGLIAKFGGKLIALILALKKIVVLFFVGVGAWFKKKLGRKTEAGKTEPPSGPPPVSPPPSDTPSDPPAP